MEIERDSSARRIVHYNNTEPDEIVFSGTTREMPLHDTLLLNETRHPQITIHESLFTASVHYNLPASLS
jgi:hypothetical protein